MSCFHSFHAWEIPENIFKTGSNGASHVKPFLDLFIIFYFHVTLTLYTSTYYNTYYSLLKLTIYIPISSLNSGSLLLGPICYLMLYSQNQGHKFFQGFAKMVNIFEKIF